MPIGFMEGGHSGEAGMPAKRHDRFRLEPVLLRKQKPAERVHNWNEVFLGFTPEEATHEASRCLECEHAPCVQACPLHNPIPEAMFHIAQGQFAEAALMFLSSSNMPDICGRICPQEKLCEGACILYAVREPVRIGKLEAFCVDYLRDRYGYPLPAVAPWPRNTASKPCASSSPTPRSRPMRRPQAKRTPKRSSRSISASETSFLSLKLGMP